MPTHQTHANHPNPFQVATEECRAFKDRSDSPPPRAVEAYAGGLEGTTLVCNPSNLGSEPGTPAVLVRYAEVAASMAAAEAQAAGVAVVAAVVVGEADLAGRVRRRELAGPTVRCSSKAAAN